MAERIYQEPKSDSDSRGEPIDRRGFLECMAWCGTGLLWTVSGGVLSSRAFGDDSKKNGEFTFVQISDSHIGFSKPVNADVTATLQETIAQINKLPKRPDLLLHTGDLTHLARPEEFDTVAQVIGRAKVGHAAYVPGEHDVFVDDADAKRYLDRYGKGARGTGWHSFDHKGVHFVGLVNVMDLKAGGLGQIGTEQLKWLKADLAKLGESTPIVIFAHVPLWMVYPKWGWGTADGAEALSYVERFGSVTVLNGHIHQILQKVEGNVTFHTARSTAFPQPEPGKAESPGPLKNVPADKLRGLLGLTQVKYVAHESALAIVDSTLG